MRRTNLLLQHDLERRLRTAQSRELDLQAQLDEAKRELDTVKDANRRLVEDDAWKEDDWDKKRVEHENDKVRGPHARAHHARLESPTDRTLHHVFLPYQKSLQASLHKLRMKSSATESENLSLTEALSSAERSSKHTITSLTNDVHLLRSKLDASENECRVQQDKADDRLVEVKSLRARVGELVEEVEKAKRDEGEEKVGRVLREELHRKSTYEQSR